MAYPVFLSYARKSSREYARKLHEALGGDSGHAFLDTSDIETGERFPAVLVDAILGTRVLVVFAEEIYFDRDYCLLELEAALRPFTALLKRHEITEGQKSAALAHIVITLPPEGFALDRQVDIPPLLRTNNWPCADATDELAALVRERLSTVHDTILESLNALGEAEALRHHLLEKTLLPPPLSLNEAAIFPRQLSPSIGRAFVGRADDLWRIHKLLSHRRGKSAALTGAIEGGGGFGKTRLALEYLHRLGPVTYPGGLFWVDADVDESRLEEQLHGILKTLKPDVPDIVPFRESNRNAARELEETLHNLPADMPVLYIVDNVPESPPKPLTTWCPALGKVSLLATSRAKLSLGTEGIEPIPIDTLSSDAAVALLSQEIDRASLDEASWQVIASWVGNLPLALELLNRALRSKSLSPQKLLDYANTKGPTCQLDEQMKALQGKVPAGQLRGITTAFDISYKLLSTNEKKAARLLAHLSPEPIPEALLDAIGPKIISASVRSTLVSRSFISDVESSIVPFFGRMHRVLADFLRTRSKKTADELRVVCKALGEVMDPDACRDPKSWPFMNACLSHATQVFGQKDLGAPAAPETYIKLSLSIGILLAAQGNLRDGRTFDEATVQMARTLLGSEHLLTLTAMNNLANTLSDQGNLSGARCLQEQVLEIRRRILGSEHSDTLMAMNNLARTLSGQGDLPNARILEEQALEARRRILGSEHPETLTAMNNLAQTLSDQGDLPGARKLQEQVLDARRRILGSGHPDTNRAMHNLASTLSYQGDFTGARVLQEQVLEGQRRIFGSEHSVTLTAMNNLAAILYAQGDLAGARVLQEQVLEVMRRIQGSKHPDTLTAMINLAQTLKAQGNLTDARSLEEHVLDARSRILGSEHPDTITAMDNLATTRSDQGDLTAARDLQEQVLDASRRILGNDHPDTLTTMNNLALTLLRQRDLPGARVLQEQVLETSRRILGSEHPNTLAAVLNLAGTLSAQGDLTGARILQEQALEARRRILGSEHPETLTAMNNFAATLFDQGDLTGARSFQEQVLEGRRRILGNEHPDTITAKNNLAKTLSDLGDLTGARDLQEQVLEARRRILGGEHPDTLRAMNLLAQTLSAQGDLTSARVLQEQVLDARRRILGSEHPDTLAEISNLALILSAQGDLSGARDLQEQVLDVRRRNLGDEHQDTTTAAWNLFVTLLQMNEIPAAQDVFHQNIRWLMERDPSTLGIVHRQIQEQFKELIAHVQKHGEPTQT